MPAKLIVPDAVRLALRLTAVAAPLTVMLPPDAFTASVNFTVSMPVTWMPFAPEAPVRA